jgi:hypothetical protein
MNEKLVTFTEEILSTLQNVYQECRNHSSESQILSAIVTIKQIQLTLFAMPDHVSDDYDPLDYCSPV